MADIEGGAIKAGDPARAAKTALGEVPLYATWTEAQGHDFIDATVVDLDSARTVLKGYWTMICLMRDYILSQRGQGGL